MEKRSGEYDTNGRVFVDEARVMNHLCKPYRSYADYGCPTKSKGEFKSSVTKKASTMPRNTVCVMASAIMDMRRSTRNTPGIAHAMDTAMAMSKISVCTVIGHLLCEAAYPLLYISFVVSRRDLSFAGFLIIKLVLIVCFYDIAIRCLY